MTKILLSAGILPYIIDTNQIVLGNTVRCCTEKGSVGVLCIALNCNTTCFITAESEEQGNIHLSIEL